MATNNNFDPEEESDTLSITPLGAGQEVGRSCILMKFKGKKIILDCGIHPGLRSQECLPFIDQIDNIETTDLVLVSHFHLDHCGGLPHLLLKTKLRCKCYMTHATKAIYRWMLADYIRVSSSAQSAETALFSEADIKASLDHIDAIDFHQEIEVGGIKFTAYHAGHVLGASMFMIEIAGVKILYTGDFSRQEDRHLMCAEMPPTRPDVLITESTYGTHIHDKREEREQRFTSLVYEIVIRRGGRCLIPVFALGRAQELMLILDEFWEAHPELQGRVPIYYCSQLARKCMAVYQTYIHAMNDNIKRQMASSNPFLFKHISSLKSMEQFTDMGPCVVMASPGMMQSGLSRELFENWCTDKRNGVIVVGYCVEGTLAKLILSQPTEVPTMAGQMLPLKCSVDYISFSAHTDYQQTSEFIRELKPNHIILVHGEQNEMARLRNALQREYEDDETYAIDVHTPKNCEDVVLRFRGEKMCKVVGELAKMPPSQEPAPLSGVLVKKNFSYIMLTPKELPTYTDMATSQVTQCISMGFQGPPSLLLYHLTLLAGDVEIVSQSGACHVFRVFQVVQITWKPRMVTIEWQSNPVNDMYADAVQTLVLRADVQGMPWQGIPKMARMSEGHFQHCLLHALKDMFGAETVSLLEVALPLEDVKKVSASTVLAKREPSTEEMEMETGDMQSSKGSRIMVTVAPNKTAEINLDTLLVECKEDKKFEQLVSLTVQRIYQALMPVPADG